MLIITFNISILLFLFLPYLPPGAFAVGFISLCCATFNFFCFAAILKVDRFYTVYKYSITYFVLQPVFFLLCVLFYPSHLASAVSRTDLFSELPFSLFGSFCLVPLLGLIVAVLLQELQKGRQESIVPLHELVQNTDLEEFLIFAAMINLSIWLTVAFADNVFFYVLRFLRSAFVLVPLLAGLYFNKSKKVTCVWLMSFAIGMFLSTVTGCRGYGYWPPAFYAIGFILQQERTSRRLSYSLLFITLLPFGMFLNGFAANLRSEVGRTGITTVNLEQVGSHFEEVFKESSTVGKSSALWIGLYRMVNKTLVFVPNMAGESVSYRGYSDFPEELQCVFFLGGPAGGLWNLGHPYNSRKYASPYGFTSYITYKDGRNVGSSTVPFNVVADSWSRCGLPSALFQLSLALVLLIFMEKINWRLTRNHPNIQVVMGFVLAKIAFVDLNIYTLCDVINTIWHSYPVILFASYGLVNFMKKDRRVRYRFL